MRFEAEQTLLRVFIGESDRYEGKPLYAALVDAARKHGLAGATVVRGAEGYGAGSRAHDARLLRLSEDLPIIVEVVDASERIAEIAAVFDAMIGDGMMTLERAQIVSYQGTRPRRDASVVRDRLRILSGQAAALAGSEPDEAALEALYASIRATHEYGASEDAIVLACGLPPSEVRAALHGVPPVRPRGDEAREDAS